MWPGGEFTYQGKNITYAMPFEAGYDWHKRVDQVGNTKIFLCGFSYF